MRYVTKRQIRLGPRVVPAGDIVELTASAARYLKLRGWIEPAPPSALAADAATEQAAPRRRQSRRRTS